MSEHSVIVDGRFLTIEDICAVALRHKALCLSDEPIFVTRINKGSQFVDALLQKQGYIYGVTTGYGDSCDVPIPLAYVNDLSTHLYTFHGCGLGHYFDESQNARYFSGTLK
ncbi:aromatic amino acid lyase [Methylocucumis oryzae]|uniref:aromatic amino acid lyase n=1 Tax=Methylocucumis oryzae TaxID=1632867 RepID=UPI000AA74378|nr:aromatic amino acid lyase [Methylocucumis oryzae]